MSRDVRETINYHVHNELYTHNFRANRWRAGDSWEYPIKDLGIQPATQSKTVLWQTLNKPSSKL